MFDKNNLRRIVLGCDQRPCFFAELNSPVGFLTSIFSERGLHALLFEQERANCESDFQCLIRQLTHDVFLETCAQLDEYFKGLRQVFEIPIVMFGTEFQLSVWNKLREIPYGQVMTYSQQASAMGNVRLTRAVGLANSKNPVSIIVPCHRVVGQKGGLVGFAGGLNAKEKLLALERRVE